MRDLLTKMKPDKFADIIATSALYRPGPLEGGMVMDYVNVKHDRQPVAEVHPIVDPVLAETYGVMVYQEQVMRILNRLGGIELASAYKCIKAISKKKQEIIDSFYEQFMDGAQQNDMGKDQAQEIWNLIVKFAGYGFNKSHSTAYGAIAYQTAFLKAHYPEEFMAALLSCGMESSDRISEHTDDCRRMGIKVLAPDVNLSDVEFTVVVREVQEETKKKSKKKKKSDTDVSAPEEERVLAFGLGAIKGVGEAAMQGMVDERNANGPFKNIFDLCERCDAKHMTKGTLESLIKAGALDTFGPNRAQHILVIERAVQAAAALQRDKAKGQMNLFGGGGDESDDVDDGVTIPPADDWTHSFKLNAEREVFGFYLTSHPLTEYADQIESFTQHTTKDLKELGDGKDVVLGGMISAIKKAQTKNPSRNGNSKYVNFDLEDPAGVVRCIMWPDDFADAGEKVVQDSIAVVKGRIDARGREPNIIINQLLTLEEAEREFTRQIAIRFQKGLHDAEDMQRVREVLNRFPGKTPIVIAVDTVQKNRTNVLAAAGVNGNGQHANDHQNGNGNSYEESMADEEAPPATENIRALVATEIQVTAHPELKEELHNILGEDGYRFQAVPVKG